MTRRGRPLPALTPAALTPAALTPAALGAALGAPLPPPGARVGLLGGSFNPAHEGHRAITLEALKRLDLDRVWWLVSPQNPLKSPREMAPLAERVARARQAAAGDRRIVVTGLEASLGSAYTADTLRSLTRLLPRVRFVWLMGADNLIQVHNWQDWPQIFNTLPVAVFDRPSYSLGALSGKAAQVFARFRLKDSSARRLAEARPPAWVFIRCRLNPQSATEIRARAPLQDQTGASRAQGDNRQET